MTRDRTWHGSQTRYSPSDSDEHHEMNGHLHLDIGMILGEVRQGLRDIREDTHEIKAGQSLHGERIELLEGWQATTQMLLDDHQTRKAERRAHQLKLAEKAGWYCASLILATLTWSGKLPPELLKVLKAAMAKAGGG